MDALRQGLRYAWRMLVRSTGFTTLATVALPYAGPERLALV